MTREEQIKKAALKECKSFDIPDKEGLFKGVNSAYGLGFCEGAMWADANPYINWQQVRIQAAIAAMQGFCANPNYFELNSGATIPEAAIVYSDDLIEKLKGK